MIPQTFRTCLRLRRKHVFHKTALSVSFSSDVIQGPSLLRTSLDRPNPSLIHLPGLRSLPFWTQSNGSENRIAYQDKQVTFCVEHLQSHWETLSEEYHKVAPQLKSDYEHATEHTLHEGNWEWHSYMLKGKIQGHFCAHFPETTKILQVLRDQGLLFEGTPFGYSFYSTLHPKSKIAPHTSPMNFRLRIHLPLVVPSASSKSSTGDSDTDAQSPPVCGIRVGPMVREWQPGQALVLDDAYRHAVWNETDEARVLLLVDIWHPDVTMQERNEIIQMFSEAAAERARNAVWEG